MVAEDLVRDEYMMNYEGKEECFVDEANKSDNEATVNHSGIAIIITNSSSDLRWPLTASSVPSQTTRST
jgi:hypothetical protein